MVEQSNVMEQRRWVVMPPEVVIGAVCGVTSYSPQTMDKHPGGMDPRTKGCKECKPYVPTTYGISIDHTKCGVPIPIPLTKADAEWANRIYKEERDAVVRTWGKLQEVLEYQDEDSDPKDAPDDKDSDNDEEEDKDEDDDIPVH